MKGIILAGGSGTRLRPVTLATSKQLLPLYNKPMVYFPLVTLLRAGIKDILIIVAPDHAGDFLQVLGSGKDFGARFTYEVQDKPNGLAEAFILGETFIGDDSCALILGDNYFDDDFTEAVQTFEKGARVFAKKVSDPHRYGVVAFDENNMVTSLIEKPKNPVSDYAVVGMYIYDNSVVEKAKALVPSARGELEITDLNNVYLAEGTLDVDFVEGAWFDCGTFESWFEATSHVRSRALDA